ncbi:MAG: CoB--CoM heterodisulfide reductase iron-sulfur subunit B family protein [Deltaproteobacteria bacterium]|nr:CoB--CoM heterodisulfide reductase iron-sulfur subunit B family protein [Deltaproteobacteria bacterium]MBW2070543.1 CoB--CoM heterodisulfide reductase iron-sulfur subunit B family protein [Deltaproteobacteria bacterium]
MKVSYYPGCSLEGTARDYRESLESVAAKLEIHLQELEDWNCCGATAAHSIDDVAALILPGRNLVIAEQAGLDLVVPCALCFNRLKTAEKAFLQGKMPRSDFSFTGKIKVWDLLDFFAQPWMLPEIRARVTAPLIGLEPVCYYGCVANRPPKVTDAAQPENPQNMDVLLTTLGARVIDWPHKTDCCGASHAVARPDIVFQLVHRLYQRALRAGANCIVVSCQMCQANLDMYQEHIGRLFGASYYLPIFYFTELMGLAMGLREVGFWLARHMVDPQPLLARAKLL